MKGGKTRTDHKKVWRRDVERYIAGLMEQTEAIHSLALVHAYLELVLSQLLYPICAR